MSRLDGWHWLPALATSVRSPFTLSESRLGHARYEERLFFTYSSSAHRGLEKRVFFWRTSWPEPEFPLRVGNAQVCRRLAHLLNCSLSSRIGSITRSGR